MRIAILGSGSVGMSLARGFLRGGHYVVVGTRDTNRPEIAEWLAASATAARATDYREAVQGAELVVLAVPGRLVRDEVREIGAEHFAGAIVVDATNPLLFTDSGAEAAYGEDFSAAEAVAAELPGVAVVKAFNQIGAERMLDPDTSAGPAVMRIAGDDSAAKQRVTELLEPYGWTIEDRGPLREARALEGSTLAWIRRTQAANG
jgi:predicted dinucleotide-binding enzyme